jgi:hypothetical protein
MVAEPVSVSACDYLRAACSQDISGLSSGRTTARWNPINGCNKRKHANDGRQSGEAKRALPRVLQGGMVGAPHCGIGSVRVRMARITRLIGLIVSNRTIAMMLTNRGMWANIVARTAALLSLEFAIASAVCAALCIWRIVPTIKNFPSILRYVSSTPASVNLRLTRAASRQRNTQMNTCMSGRFSHCHLPT